MVCERCNVEMKKIEARRNTVLTYEEKKYPNGQITQTPICAKSVYICPECGKIELNINE